MKAPRSKSKTGEHRLAGILRHLARTVVASAGRRRNAVQMRSLSDAYLRDIGMSRFGIAWSVPHDAARPVFRRTS